MTKYAAWSLVIGLALSANTARADLMTFDLTYSGSDLGNSATATATITLDLSQINNPGFTSQDSNPFVTDFSITVSGAASGNGAFDFGAFDVFFDGEDSHGGFYLDTGGAFLDFGRELIGQPTALSPFGTPDGEGGDFGFYANGTVSTAPTSTDVFQITTDDGHGDSLLLTSFRPRAVPEPGGLALIASGLAAILGHAGWRRFRTARPTDTETTVA